MSQVAVLFSVCVMATKGLAPSCVPQVVDEAEAGLWGDASPMSKHWDTL